MLITATNGEQGEPKPGVLADGEPLAERRLVELERSAKILGAELLLMGYEDSGMMGEPANDNPACFWQADLDDAAGRLADLLREIEPDVLTIYDEHGLYGHPDHIKVHQVGLRAAELVGLDHVYLGTVNRDRALAGFSAMREHLGPDADLPDPDDFAEFGMPENDLSYEIDATAFAEVKKEALSQHRSQVSPDDFFLAMPDEAFVTMFGWETYAIPGVTGTGGPEVVELLPGL
ncbi:MAG: PIG-L family deacetylase [Acidimicrobiales bacterium]